MSHYFINSSQTTLRFNYGILNGWAHSISFCLSDWFWVNGQVYCLITVRVAAWSDPFVTLHSIYKLIPPKSSWDRRSDLLFVIDQSHGYVLKAYQYTNPESNFWKVCSQSWKPVSERQNLGRSQYLISLKKHRQRQAQRHRYRHYPV